MKTALDKVSDPVARAALEQRACELMTDAVRQHGLEAVESTRRIATVHEAGHAVIFQITADGIRWWPPYELRVFRLPVRGAMFWSGYTDVSPKAPPESVDTRVDPNGAVIFIMRAISGWLAEQLFCPPEDRRPASSVDELLLAQATAGGLAAHWECSPPKAFDRVTGLATDMLERNQTPLLRLADALERTRKVAGADLKRLLAGVKYP